MPPDQHITANIRLGMIQLAIEQRVRQHNIPIAEWNLKGVEKVLGDLLKYRDRMISMLNK